MSNIRSDCWFGRPRTDWTWRSLHRLCVSSLYYPSWLENRMQCFDFGPHCSARLCGRRNGYTADRGASIKQWRTSSYFEMTLAYSKWQALFCIFDSRTITTRNAGSKRPRVLMVSSAVLLGGAYVQESKGYAWLGATKSFFFTSIHKSFIGQMSLYSMRYYFNTTKKK